jgi:hypothetical protein
LATISSEVFVNVAKNTGGELPSSSAADVTLVDRETPLEPATPGVYTTVRLISETVHDNSQTNAMQLFVASSLKSTFHVDGSFDPKASAAISQETVRLVAPEGSGVAETVAGAVTAELVNGSICTEATVPSTDANVILNRLRGSVHDRSGNKRGSVA